MAPPSFDALRDLHDSANDLLHSPKIRQIISHLRQEKFVHEISEASLRMLDSCGTTKDVLMLVKDHLQDLQSTFRRVSLGESNNNGEKFAMYSFQRKKLKKEMLKRLHSLKGMKNKCMNDQEMYELDQNLMVVVNVLKEVRVTTMAIVETLMSLMAMPSCPKRKVNKGLFLGKMLTRVDSIILWEKCDTTAFEIVYKRLEVVEIAIEDLEDKLECMFRRLIRTRVSLLNILTD
ncbi:hypothetical protein Leryth_017611 [Lithospermum erythrorhizon]|uniref:Uncharacterized protein n=1 Tax=Lithospermum erythrorhizon TaxID=34254 RepID=A0AAV3Q5J2_LITER|nr:hypothetical protein Leryth_017611 [Lithospermum erythrorhizon]